MSEAPRPRSPIQRLGLGAVALAMALLFGGVTIASWMGGEVFLAAIGGIGCLMTVWVGTLTVLRG